MTTDRDGNRSNPYHPNPDACCEACVFGRGKHASWCFVLTEEMVDALGDPRGMVRVGFNPATRSVVYRAISQIDPIVIPSDCEFCPPASAREAVGYLGVDAICDQCLRAYRPALVVNGYGLNATCRVEPVAEAYHRIEREVFGSSC